MQTVDILTLTGLLLNILGSAILAVSLSRYLTSMHGALAIHDMQIEAIVRKDDRVLAGDVANLLRNGVENGRKRTNLGLILIIAGFIVQVAPFIVTIINKK